MTDTCVPQTVLVVVMNNQRDWQGVCEQGWYRIPVLHAPQPVAADYLAFYQTRVFGSAAWQISFYAPVQRYSIVARRHLVPEEPAHPRADQLYYRIEVGAVQRLERPVPSRRLRRLTFIPTTMEQLCRAEDVVDLWQASDVAVMLWSQFHHAAIKATKRLIIDDHEMY